MEPSASVWRKSSYSSNTGACVEVADAESQTLVRDSTRPDLGRLAFASGAWHAFLSSLKGTSTTA